MNEVNDQEVTMELEWGAEPSEAICTRLLEELKDSIFNATPWKLNVDLAEDTTWCLWGGQSDDGLKHDDDSAEVDAVFPWDGSSDSRPRLSDRLVREATRIQKSAWRRSRIQLAGTEMNDEAQAQKLTTLLKWMVNTRMRPHFKREQQLAAYWRVQLGVSFTLTEWERNSGLEMTEMDLEGLLEVYGLQKEIAGLKQMMGTDDGSAAALQFLQAVGEAGPADEQVAALYQKISDAMSLLTDETRREELLDVLEQLFPTVARARLNRSVTELHATGRTMLPQPVTIQNRPRRRALKPFADVFMPVGVRSIEDAWWVAVREWKTEAELRDLVLLDEWDAEFVDELMEKGDGKTALTDLLSTRAESSRWQTSRKSKLAGESDGDEMKGFFEVYTFYYYASDPDTGVRGLFKTVLSPHIYEEEKEEEVSGELYAWHGLCEDPSGEIPIVEHVFWRDCDGLFDNVGVPMLVYTAQQEIKAQRDARTDWTSLRIQPMWRRHPRDQGTPLVLAPRMELIEAVRGRTEPVELPDLNLSDSKEIEMASLHDSNVIVGSMADGDVPEIYAMLVAEDLAAEFLEEEQQVLTRIWQLCQKNLAEEDVQRVTGPLRIPFKVSLEEIRQGFDLTIDFDAEHLNPEMRAAKLKLGFEILMRDTQGAFDRNKALKDLLTLADARWAESWSVPRQVSDQKEKTDEKMNIAMILSGIEPDMVPEGQNYALRNAVWEEQLNGEQPNQTLLKLMSDKNDQRGAMAWNRMKHLKFMVEQQTTNKEAGFVGAKPEVG